MKIVQFMASQGWGGAESVFVELSNELAAEHEVTVLLLRDSVYKNRFASSVRLIELRANPTRYNPLLALELFSLLKKMAPDLIHTHAAKATELVSSVNRMLLLPHLGTKHNNRKGRIFNSIPFVSAVSQAAADSIDSKREDGLIEIIYNGIIPEQLPNRKKFQCFTIIAAGRLDPIKGFDILIRQAATIPFAFQLLIAGVGPERDDLQQLIDQLGMESTIKLLGQREDLAALMTKSHLIVISSHSEGFSKVLIEALFYGEVAISTPVGVAPEILPTELLVRQQDLGQKIREIHDNYEHYKKLFHEIRERKSTDFLMPRITRRYIDLYEKIRAQT